MYYWSFCMTDTFIFKTKDCSVKINATTVYGRTFRYTREYGDDIYVNVSFFLTDQKDICMTVGRVRNMDRLFDEGGGKFNTPFFKVLSQSDIDHASRLNILGLKINVNGKTFLERLMDKLDVYIYKECEVAPLGSPKGMDGIFKMKPFLDMLLKSNIGQKHTSLIEEAITHLETDHKISIYMECN